MISVVYFSSNILNNIRQTVYTCFEHMPWNKVCKYKVLHVQLFYIKQLFVRNCRIVSFDSVSIVTIDIWWKYGKFYKGYALAHYDV